MCCLAKQKSYLSNLYPSVERQKFDLSTRSRELRLCVKTKYALAWCFMFHSFKFYLQHAYFQLQKRFDPIPGVNGVCKDRTALCSITFNLILRVCEIKDFIWVMRFQSPLVYVIYFGPVAFVYQINKILKSCTFPCMRNMSN